MGRMELYEDEKIAVEESPLYDLLVAQVATINHVSKSRPQVIYYPSEHIVAKSIDDAFSHFFDIGEEKTAEIIVELSDSVVGSVFLVEPETVPENVKLLEDITTYEIGNKYYREFLAALRQKYSVETKSTLQVEKLRKMSNILSVETENYVNAIRMSPYISDDIKNTIINSVLLDYGIVFSNYTIPDKDVTVETHSDFNKGIIQALSRLKGTFPELHKRYMELENLIPTYVDSIVPYRKMLFGTFAELYVYQILSTYGDPHLSSQNGDVNYGYDIVMSFGGYNLYFDIKCGREFNNVEIRLVDPKIDSFNFPALLRLIQDDNSRKGIIVRFSAKLLSALTVFDPMANIKQNDIKTQFTRKIRDILK